MEPSSAELAQWTPVGFGIGERAATIDWGDLRGTRFAEPFFHQTVERWAGGNPRPLVRTGLDTLRALDGAPSLDPAALIFHVSRCGSTLLSRLLGCAPGVMVLSEPAPLNALLLADPAALDGEPPSEALRLLVRALGRRRFGDERHFVLKLSSWNITRLALFRRAFPQAALVWLGRKPHEVVASLIADPPGWLALRHDPAEAAAAFGIDHPAPDAATFCVQAVAAMLGAAAGIDGEALFLDYGDLPQAAWERVAPFLGIDIGASDLARMRDLARYQAKDAAPRPFTADAKGARSLAPAVRALVDDWAAPLHEVLARRSAAHVRDLTRPVCL
jgi:hypothetical protein